MAREKVDEAEHADRAGTGAAAGDQDTPNQTPTPPAPRAGSSKRTSGAKDSGTGKQTSGTKESRTGKPASGAKDSGTAAAATRHRAEMQRRHLRIGLLMSIALGAEVIGAAGLLGSGLLPWQWQDVLWGATGGMLVTVQVGIGLVVLGLLLAWWRRGERVSVQSRVALLIPAGLVLLLAVVTLWQADLGGRGVGAVVAMVAAALVIGGTSAWLIGLRRLRVLFPFGLADARTRGFGNLPAVRRAARIGGPASALGGAALLAGTVLVVPAWISTVDSQLAEPLALTGEPATATGDPAWTVELVAGHEGRPTAVRATDHGLLIEEAAGVRAVDPRTGAAHWHWRDEAYERVGSALVDNGRVLVLALEYLGSISDRSRDRVVALDTGTGEVRWERTDRELVEAMARAVWAPPAGDWFVVPEQLRPPGTDGPGTVGLLALDAEGERRWQVAEDEDCSFLGVGADVIGALVVTQQCVSPSGDGTNTVATCRVTAHDGESGQPRWSWPQPDEVVADCSVYPVPELVVIVSNQEQDRIALGIDPVTGEELWTLTAGGDEDLAGLESPKQIRDLLVGSRLISSGGDLTHSELVVRGAADGEVRRRIGLPPGQPIEVVAAGGGHAAVSLYRTDSAELVMVDVDLADGTTTETVVGGAPEGMALRRVTMASGPDALTLDMLVAIGAEPGPGDYRLHVRGW